jgi:hypothetical protein
MENRNANPTEEQILKMRNKEQFQRRQFQKEERGDRQEFGDSCKLINHSIPLNVIALPSKVQGVMTSFNFPHSKSGAINDLTRRKVCNIALSEERNIGCLRPK